MTGQTNMRHPTLPESINATTGVIVDSAIAVHRELGPGMLEQVYLQCLVYELRSRGAQVETQVRLPVVYRTGWLWSR
jgi:GxxExxY protein